MSHLQFIESLSTNLMTSKKRKQQHLRNTSAVSAAPGKKLLNDMKLLLLDSRLSHQRKAKILDARATPI